MARPQVQAYKLIKLSQFLFRTARQKERIKREWDALVNGTACGPEILAMRTTYNGSVAAVARAIHDLIRSGNDRLRPLNTHRVLEKSQGVGPRHAESVKAWRHELETEFHGSLAAGHCAETAPTGLTLDAHQAKQLSI